MARLHHGHEVLISGLTPARLTDRLVRGTGARQSFASSTSGMCRRSSHNVARRTREPDLVLDVVAETFARALEHRDQYDASRGPAVAWLFGIARNELAAAVRELLEELLERRAALAGDVWGA
jgi:DNA-directed RNA polymerase specialized sigma24 family protein